MEDNFNDKNKKIYIAGFNKEYTSIDEFYKIFGEYGRITSLFML